jgi:hypothetical protein
MKVVAMAMDWDVPKIPNPLGRKHAENGFKQTIFYQNEAIDSLL